MGSYTIKNIPLFPLKVVLFPGSILPLHIFEERYKSLINECLKNGGEFGINFIDGEKMDPVGCSATVRSVLKQYSDGRLDITVEGGSRYTVRHLVEDPAPYFVARVAFFEDEEEDLETALRRDTIALYNRFIEIGFKGMVERVESATNDRMISFRLAQKAGLELKERQALLGARSENERLKTLKRHFEATLPLMVSKEKIERIVLNDGYLSPK